MKTLNGGKPQNQGARVWRASRRYSFLFLGLAADAALVSLAFYSAYLLRFHCGPLLHFLPVPVGVVFPWSQYFTILPTVAVIWLSVLFFGVKIYEEPPLPIEDKIVRILSGSFKAMIAVLALSFLSKRYSDSRLLPLLTAPLAVLYLIIGHTLMNFFHRVLFPMDARDKLLVIGEGRLAVSLIRKISRLHHRQILQKPPLAKNEIITTARAESVREVLLVQALLSQEDIVKLAEELEFLDIQLRVVPSLLELRIGEIQVDNSLGLPMLCFGHLSLSGENFAIKRIFDLCFSFFILILGSAPIILIAALIKLDSSGPIFYKQKRVGYLGREFWIYKFRTMVADAEEKRAELESLNVRLGPVFKMKSDPRITRVGRWLRRLSLDEIPQFFNVIKGDMSTVGPRPPIPTEVAQYDAAALRRLNVLPGLTGLWQVSGRADLSFQDMVELDIFYIERWSLGLDIKIILMTPYAMISSKGAY